MDPIHQLCKILANSATDSPCPPSHEICLQTSYLTMRITTVSDLVPGKREVLVYRSLFSFLLLLTVSFFIPPRTS